jgi:hypothetical protein
MRIISAKCIGHAKDTTCYTVKIKYLWCWFIPMYLIITRQSCYINLISPYKRYINTRTKKVNNDSMIRVFVDTAISEYEYQNEIYSLQNRNRLLEKLMSIQSKQIFDLKKTDTTKINEGFSIQRTKKGIL